MLCCANFSMVYPAVEIVCRGKSISHWLEDRSEAQAKLAAQHAADLAQVVNDQQRLDLQQAHSAAERKAERYSKLQALADTFLPATAFGTLLIK